MPSTNLPSMTPETWQLFERGGGMSTADAEVILGPVYPGGAVRELPEDEQASFVAARKGAHKLNTAMLRKYNGINRLGKIWPAIVTHKPRLRGAGFQAEDGTWFPTMYAGPSGAPVFLTEAESLAAAQAIGKARTAGKEPTAADLPDSPKGGFVGVDKTVADFLPSGEQVGAVVSKGTRVVAGGLAALALYKAAKRTGIV